MELRFIAPHLRRLDCATTEVLATILLEDERPAHGVAGLIDWRLSGRLTTLMLDGFATGRLGEVLLLPGKPHMPFDKLLLFGAGTRADFGERVYREVLQKILTTLEGLRARSAVVQLPGRHFGGIDAEQATTILLQMAADHPDHDVWTLVEPPEVQRAIAQQLAQERRRSHR
jgi:hypothetical protein